MGIEEAILKEVREQGIEKDRSVTDIAGVTELTVGQVEQFIAGYEAEK